MTTSKWTAEDIPSLDGKTLQDLWRESVQEVGGQASAAATAAQASAVVLDSLESQRAGISGVSIDEESINLLEFQRQYQAAATQGAGDQRPARF